ncbi:MAG: class I SAM-dependent methyltransferase [Chitinophagaceae bacterium]|nr:class I SAM-dependent methyltransferase [Chitinophagaceae bacterium]
MMQDVYLRSDCRMCGGRELERVMTLTSTPPGNNFLKKEEIGNEEVSYPLDLYFCNNCYHIQLGHVVDPKILYQNSYSYLTGTSAYFVKHLRDYAADMARRFELKPGMFVADIGSNDGTCLRGFQELGMNVLGVDPATEIAQNATNAGIETIADFFSYNLSVKLKEKYGPVQFITSHNACAHIDQLDDVIRGVSHWLDDNGVFVLEVGYFVDVYSNLFFDTIYHEHVDFHTVGPFKKLFERTGMELIAVERISPQGGSIRVMAQKIGGPHQIDNSVAELLKLESDLHFDKAATFADFGKKIDSLGKLLRTLIQSLKANGESIAAYGAPTKATTLLTHFGIGAESIDFTVEDNLLKQGLYMPLSHIPVLPTEELYKQQPDYVLILAWNFAKPIMEMHNKYAENGGRFILPMPIPKII